MIVKSNAKNSFFILHGKRTTHPPPPLVVSINPHSPLVDPINFSPNTLLPPSRFALQKKSPAAQYKGHQKKVKKNIQINFPSLVDPINLSTPHRSEFAYHSIYYIYKCFY